MARARLPDRRRPGRSGTFWPLIGIGGIGGGGGVTGGIVDGTRSSEPVQAGRFGHSRSGWKTAATCCPIQRLLLEQRTDQVVEDIPVLGEDVERLLVGVADQLGDLLVDDRGDLLGVVATVTDVAAQEGFGVAGTELDRPEPLGHPVLGHHGARHGGGLLDVVAGAGGRVVEDQLLGRPAAHHVRELVEQLGTGVGVLVLSPAAPWCSRGPGRAAGSSPSVPGRCLAAPQRPARGRPRDRR